ncbi:MAG: 3-methyl-2-oxobutanoate hydroxymethyltransferase [Candidatus Nitrosopolaris sp.]
MHRQKNYNNTNTRIRKNNVNDILTLKKKGEKIAVLSAYDYSTSLICDKAGVDILLVGDSAGMVMLGYESTTPVSIEEMLVFCKGVAMGTKRAMVVADLPFGSYQPSSGAAIENAIRFIKVGCDAVKLEGGSEVVDTIKALVSAGIPVMGHIGLKPQTSSLWEGYKVQGKTKDSSIKLIAEARAIEQAGAFSIVLEMVTSEVAKIISKNLSVAVIGIGSGAGCDGQVLVLHDMLGIYEDIRPKFVKRYADLSNSIFQAISRYRSDVKSRKFPEEQNVFHMNSNEYKELERELQKNS